MITKDITLCGKPVVLAYNYAAEIAYEDMAGEDIIEYVKHVVEKVKEEKDPSIKKTINAVRACMQAYCDAKGTEVPLTEKEIREGMTPAENATAFLSIVQMRSDFYYFPKGEPKDKPGKSTKKSKNA